jgi:hypothetical protein
MTLSEKSSFSLSWPNPRACGPWSALTSLDENGRYVWQSVSELLESRSNLPILGSFSVRYSSFQRKISGHWRPGCVVEHTCILDSSLHISLLETNLSKLRCLRAIRGLRFPATFAWPQHVEMKAGAGEHSVSWHLKKKRVQYLSSRPVSRLNMKHIALVLTSETFTWMRVIQLLLWTSAEPAIPSQHVWVLLLFPWSDALNKQVATI